MKILILGGTGMLGSMLFKRLCNDSRYDVYATIRSEKLLKYFDRDVVGKIINNCDIDNHEKLNDVISVLNPDAVINCIGLIKQVYSATDPIEMIKLNALFPHQLERIASTYNARTIHISTDCVFSGDVGNYSEDDLPDALDIYGRSKSLGELRGEKSITLRTSIIGHELEGQRGLLEWFLSTRGICDGYTKAIFSGFPTIILSEIIANTVLQMPEMSGIYHVASSPISKYDLLKLIAEIYSKTIDIHPSGKLVINRSLNPTKFNQLTGYKAPEWREMIETMYNNKYKREC